MSRNKAKAVSDKLRSEFGLELAARAASDPSMPEGGDPVESLAEADPTADRECLEWLCSRWLGERFLIEDVPRLHRTLDLFLRYRGRLPAGERDLSAHPDEQSVWAAVSAFDSGACQDEPGGRARRRADRARAYAESEILGEEGMEGWKCAVPRTRFAARWWGRGTRWCTAMESRDYFSGYAAKGPLRVFVDPQGDKHQVHVATGSVAGADDRAGRLREFVERLPAPALQALKADAAAFIEGVGAWTGQEAAVIGRIPGSLLPADVAEKLEAEGMSRVKAVVEMDGWELLWAVDPLARWALGLRDFVWRPDAVIFLHGPGGRSEPCCLNGTSVTAGMQALGKALRKAPEGFRRAAATEIALMWRARKHGHYSDEAMAAFLKAVGVETLAFSAWPVIARRIARQGVRHRHAGAFQVPEAFMDEAVADALASAPTLDLLPDRLVTAERLASVATRDPGEAFAAARIRGFGHLVDRRMAMSAVSYRAGEGLSFVPAQFLTPEFCREAVSRWPRAAPHAPPGMLGRDDWHEAAGKVPELVLHVPVQFRDRDLYAAAVGRNGGSLCMVPAQFRDEGIVAAALEAAPDAFPHSPLPVAYETYLEGVKRSGGLLARVPLAFRDGRMCLAAAGGGQRDGFCHMPPLVARALADDPETAGLMEGWRPKMLSSLYPPDDPIRGWTPSGPRPDRLVPLSGAVPGTRPGTEQRSSVGLRAAA